MSSRIRQGLRRAVSAGKSFVYWGGNRTASAGVLVLLASLFFVSTNRRTRKKIKLSSYPPFFTGIEQGVGVKGKVTMCVLQALAGLPRRVVVEKLSLLVVTLCARCAWRSVAAKQLDDESLLQCPRTHTRTHTHGCVHTYKTARIFIRRVRGMIALRFGVSPRCRASLTLPLAPLLLYARRTVGRQTGVCVYLQSR